MHYTLEDFYFKLPEDQIAQRPLDKRDDSRLMVYNPSTEKIIHTWFKDITSYLKSDDILVLNNTRVIEARINCKRKSGGSVEILLINKLDNSRWQCITNRTSRLKNGEVLRVENDDVEFILTEKKEAIFTIETTKPLTDELLKKIGSIPLPPYIKRISDNEDATRYQTVYAENGTSVAAPTAGLHFTTELLNKIKSKGIEIETVNLTVSWGTFQPVRNNDLENHIMHKEKYYFDHNVAERLNRGRADKRRIIAVGTTSLRVLESCYHDKRYIGGDGETDIFIYPPYSVKSIDGLITNFHTPYSTLLMLVCAYGGYDKMMNAYQIAVEKNYRFFSYGDSMFITGNSL